MSLDEKDVVVVVVVVVVDDGPVLGGRGMGMSTMIGRTSEVEGEEEEEEEATSVFADVRSEGTIAGIVRRDVDGCEDEETRAIFELVGGPFRALVAGRFKEAVGSLVVVVAVFFEAGSAGVDVDVVAEEGS